MKRLSTIFGRVLLGAAALFGLAQPGMANAQARWTANSDDALLFDVRLGQYRLGDGVRGYQIPGGTCVDLADVIMALDIPVRLDKKLRRATGWAFDERHTVLIDRETGAVQIMNNVAKLGPNDIFDTPEGWCVATAKLGSWLGINLQADQGNALLIVKSTAKLPVELQMERRARAAGIRNVATFDLKSLPHSETPFRGVRMPSVDAVVSIGGLKDRSRGTGQINRSYELYAAGEVGPIAYNARLSSTRKGVPESLRIQAYRTDPEGRLLGGLKATSVAAGDISGFSTPLVAQSSAGRGAMLSNRPVERRDSFDRTDFRGELPQGWDAELYRNGQLLMFANDRADGRYEFLDVPLLYGQNRFEIVLYGPQGQIRRESRNVPVGLDSIPPRKTYYWAGVYDDGHDLIGLGGGGRFGRSGWRGTFGLERGLNARTSLAALVHSLVLEDGLRRNYAEIAVRRAVGPTLLEVSASQTSSGGSALRAQVLGELSNTYFSAESILARGHFRSDRILVDVTGLHTVSLDHSFKLGSTFLPVHLESRYTTRSSGLNSLDTAARVSTSIGRMSLTGEVNWRDERRKYGPEPPGILEASLLANARIGKVRLRGETRFRLRPDSRFDNATVVAEWSAGRGDDRYRGDWRAEIGYDRPLKRARVGLGYVRHFEKLALTGSVEAGSDGSLAGGLNLVFSLGPDPTDHGGMRMTSNRLATQGQAVARVYRDLNGDGIRQSDEPLEHDVQLTAGRVPVERLTGKDGQVLIDSLEPYQPVLIGIDASSLPDPLVQPATPGIVVTPRPGVAVAIELPLSSAGDVDGTLVRSGGGSFGGVEIELVNAEGRVTAKARTDFDGFFLFEAVPYGRYSIRIAPASADAARVSAALGGIAIVSGTTPSVHLGTIAAKATPRQAAIP
ncbi:MSCRAMM family protein [Aquisediminimonas profunda]|uniref:MSCRAMM family protein n=1 Tax=Aquisediminimonas profunda TaxID=1550733 RepID=UPI001C624A32|nr:carboxypeptidase-like regulatory domain-containing protein [Aquisediminimonas profunda]